MEDLEWLARSVHEWRKTVLYAAAQGINIMRYDLLDNSIYGYTKQQWLDKRAEIQNKPSWDDAPEWADWLAQDNDGEWCWYKEKPITQEFTFISRPFVSAAYGNVLGDWRDTLEQRPERQSIFDEVTHKVDNMTDEELIKLAKDMGYEVVKKKQTLLDLWQKQGLDFAYDDSKTYCTLELFLRWVEENIDDVYGVVKGDD